VRLNGFVDERPDLPRQPDEGAAPVLGVGLSPHQTSLEEPVDALRHAA
jgi:hypothetical protein